MTRFRLTLEYDGTDFHGWQIQPDTRTVAGVLTDALRRITGEHPALSAAGRTDAGAHAHAQVVGVELNAHRDPATLQGALNAVLPQDVAVVAAERSDPGFHARRDALTREYRYVVVCRSAASPVLRRHAWHVRGPLDVAAMRDAARALEGTHDFRAFGAPTHPGGSTIRTVHAVTVTAGTPFRQRTGLPGPRQEIVVIAVEADAFLRGMMRAIAGALVAVGHHWQSPEWIGQLLRGGAKRPAALTVAPARGLHQWAVTYPATEARAA